MAGRERLTGARRPVRADGPATRHFDLRLPGERLDRLAHRRVEARPMKHMRITTAHQSITFSRRMMLLGGAQAAVGGLLIGRMGWLAIAQNEKYQLLSREQPGPADPGAAAARLDHRPQRQADRDQQGELPGRHDPAADRQRAATIVAELAEAARTCRPTRSSGSRASLPHRAASSRSRSPTMSLTSNMRRSPSAFPIFPALPRRAASPASIPAAPPSASWSAMSAPPRPRNMRRRTRTRCC